MNSFMRVWNSMRRLNLSNFFGFWNTLTDTHKNTCYMRLKKIILKTFQNTKQNKCIWTHKKEEQSEMIGIEQCSLNSAWQSCQFSLISMFWKRTKNGKKILVNCKLCPYYVECNSKHLPGCCTKSPWWQDANVDYSNIDCNTIEQPICSYQSLIRLVLSRVKTSYSS